MVPIYPSRSGSMILTLGGRQCRSRQLRESVEHSMLRRSQFSVWCKECKKKECITRKRADFTCFLKRARPKERSNCLSRQIPKCFQKSSHLKRALRDRVQHEQLHRKQKSGRPEKPTYRNIKCPPREKLFRGPCSLVPSHCTGGL